MIPASAELELGHIDEAQAARDFTDLLNRVTSAHRLIVIRREGCDLAALVPLEHLDVLRDALARQEAERLSAAIDWDRQVRSNPPPQSWFDGDEPKPF